MFFLCIAVVHVPCNGLSIIDGDYLGMSIYRLFILESQRLSPSRCHHFHERCSVTVTFHEKSDASKKLIEIRLSRCRYRRQISIGLDTGYRLID